MVRLAARSRAPGVCSPPGDSRGPVADWVPTLTLLALTVLLAVAVANSVQTATSEVFEKLESGLEYWEGCWKGSQELLKVAWLGWSEVSGPLSS